MAKRNYFYLIAGLPDLSIDQGKLQFGSVEFREYVKSQLKRDDYQLIEWLFLPFDNQNLLLLLTQKTDQWNTAGIYTREQLELAITEVVSPDKIISDEPSGVKLYLKEFITMLFNEEELMPAKNRDLILATLYYREAMKIKNEFLREWLEFEINVKNLLVYHTAQKLSIPYDSELLNITELANSLLSKIGRDVGEAAEWIHYTKVTQLAEINEIANREKSVDLLRWSVLDEMNLFNYFSIEVVISYLIKIMMIERWLKLDPKTGEELFRKLLGDLQSGYDFPNEFSIKDGKK